MGCGGLTSRSNEMMHVCISVLDLVVVEMDGLLRYDMVRYGTVLPLGGEGMLVWRYVCVHVCWAGRCWAVLGGAVLASLSESNEKNR